MKLLIATCLILLPVQLQADDGTEENASVETAAVQEPAEEQPAREPAEPLRLVADSNVPVRYVPPRRGAPKTRVGGGTRAQVSAAPKVALLSPEHTGLTTQPSPVLYWWMSQDYAGHFEYVVTSLDAVEPELRVGYHGTMAAGIHELDLQAHQLELQEGRVYQWSVALVRDTGSRSGDVVALGTIERVGSGAVGNARELSPDGLAAAGLWYDSMQSLSRLVSDPAEGAEQRVAYRNMRAALLEQVQLPAVASWDRAAAGQG